MTVRHSPVQHLTKEELRALADAMLLDDETAKKAALSFFTRESTGLWHNRARALIARRVKHVTLTAEEKSALVESVVRRLSAGSFSEQFGDQLKMAIALDPAFVERSAIESLSSSKAHVVRYAKIAMRAIKRPNQTMRLLVTPTAVAPIAPSNRIAHL